MKKIAQKPNYLKPGKILKLKIKNFSYIQKLKKFITGRLTV